MYMIVTVKNLTFFTSTLQYVPKTILQKSKPLQEVIISFKHDILNIIIIIYLKGL